MTDGWVEAVPDFAPLLERCFQFDAVEAAYAVSEIEGDIPPWLQGRYFVNGPARFRRGDLQYRHWLDGDAMVCSLRFEREGVYFTSRFVRTPKLVQEEAAGRALFRTFGTAFPQDRLRRNVMLEPNVNVSVYPFAGTLLVFGEQCLPFELDPLTLETRGEYDFHGSLNEVSPFAAHPKIDPLTGHLVNFGISLAARQPTLFLYEFDPSGRLLRRRRHLLELPHSNHDFGLSPRYAVFYLSPLLMDFQRFQEEGVSVMDSLTWQPEKGSRILVLAREGKEEGFFEVEAGPGYCLHLINAFEEGNRLFVDLLEMERPIYPDHQPMPDLFQSACRCRPVRYVVDLESQELAEKRVLDYSLASDFPSIDTERVGKTYSDFWFLGISATEQPGRKFFDQLVHAGWGDENLDDIFQAPRGQYLGGEPVYAANPENHRQGVIIVQSHDPLREGTDFLLFDPQRVAAGPIARLPLRHRIHPGFHASFQA